tara:strand:+ start:110 stop:439 length:330 start_codon:yes stop_codon:yes gene_type:complete
MLYFKQFKNWCKAHWKWLTLLVMFVIAYVLGKNQAKNLLKMAELERNQYKEQNKNLAEEVNKKSVRDKEAIKKYEKTIELLKNEKDERIKKFENMDEEDVLKELGIKKK